MCKRLFLFFLIALAIPVSVLQAYGAPAAVAAINNIPNTASNLLLTETIGLSADSVSGMPNTEVVVPVRVKGFRDIITGQGTLSFDPAVISFVAVEQYGLGGLGHANFGTTQAAAGRVAFSWDDVTLAGKTLPDSAIIFAIRFRVAGSYGTSSPVSFSNSPVPLEFVDKDFVAAQLTLQAGQVQVPAYAVITQAIGSNSLCGGSSVVVAFTSVGAYQAHNTFSAQLSDASGSFANATVIGTGTASPIAARIPEAAQGTGYRIRVVASSPAITGTDNGSDLTIHSLPAAPALTAASRCGAGSVTLTASGAPAGGRYRWYTSQTGGTPVSEQSEAAYATPVLTATTTYYVAVLSQAGCEGPRNAITATIHALPAAPTVTAGESCGAGSIALAASGAPEGGYYRWYTAAAGGTALTGATGATYATPDLTASTTFYVSVVSAAGCESARTPVAATVNAVPATPAAAAAPVQVGGTLYLSAGTVPGASYSWTGPNGYTATGQYPAIANVTTAQSGTYSVVAISKGCRSAAATVTVRVVEVPPLTIDADSVSGLVNTEIRVPVRVLDFSDVVSMQFSIHWDTSVATFVGVEDFGLSGLGSTDFGLSQSASGEVVVSWNDASLLGQTLADSTVVFSLRLLLSGTMGQSTPVTITGSPTPVQVIDKNGFVVPVIRRAGAATIRKLIRISGKIKSEQGPGVPGVRVSATGGDAVETQADGLYAFDLMQNGTYTISPVKNNDVTVNNGITTLDIALIRRHILKIAGLDSPYKMLAADADNSSTITTTDLAAIRKVILTIDSFFPGRRLWRFVPQSFVFSEPANPFPFRDSVQVHAGIVQARSGQDFIGVKIGDVNNTWDAHTARMATAGELQLQLHDQQVVPGTEVLVPVRAYAFDQVSAYQFTLNWDPRVLAFQSVEEGAATGAFGIHKVSEGKATTTWDDPAGSSQSLPEGSPIFYVKFKAIGPLYTQTEVAITSALTRSMAYNQDLEQLNVIPRNARIQLRPTAAPVLAGYALHQNAPNPIGAGGTVFRFSIPQQEEVSISIYNALGQLIRNLKGTYAAGDHEVLWDGKDSQGQQPASGTFFYQMQAGRFMEAKRAQVL